MKWIHISDLHIGLRLMNRDLAEDQAFILRQIADIAASEQPDAILIAGDIYDKAVPSAEAVALFDAFIDQLAEAAPGMEIMLISGNHDSGPRLDCFRNVLAKQSIHMIGLPPQTESDYIEKVVLRDDAGSVNFYLLPFVKPSMVKQIVGTDENGNNLSYEESLRRLLAREDINESERNVLMSHQFYLPAGKDADDVDRADSEIRTAGNIDAVSAEVLAPFDYAALGHSHKPMKVGTETLRYCGTPLACSVSEAGQQKGVILVEASGKRAGDPNGACMQTSVLPLAPKRAVRKISGTLQEVLAQRCEDYVSVTLQNEAEDAAYAEGELAAAGADAESAGAAVDPEAGNKKQSGKESLSDVQDRIRSAFPYLLEIRREYVRTAEYTAAVTPEKQLDPYELCCAFLKNPDAAERELLRDVINAC